MTQAHKILVFTDLHMTVTPREGCPEPASRLRAGLDHALATNADADMILFCGDLTHWGDEASYRRLKPFLDDLPIPIIPMLGNHDDRAAFRSIFHDAPADPDGFVQQVTDLGEYRLITLDTLLLRGEGEPIIHAGELCAKRMAWLNAALAGAGEAPCIIAMHHPPHVTGFEAMDGIMLREGEAFHDLIQRHGNVRYLLCGHVHRMISGVHRGTPWAVFKSTVGQMPLVFRGTDSSVENHDPPAFGIVLLNDDGVIVHTEDFPVA